MAINIRRVYLYLTSLIGLIVILIGTMGLVNIALKTWVLTKADTANFRHVCERPVAIPEAGQEVSETGRLSGKECEQRIVEEKTAHRQRDAAQDIAMILVGLPIYLYHWSRVKHDTEEPQNRRA